MGAGFKLLFSDEPLGIVLGLMLIVVIGGFIYIALQDPMKDQDGKK